MVKDVYYGKTLRKSFATTRRDPWTCPTCWRSRRTPTSGSWTRACARCSGTWPPSRTITGNLELSFIDYTMDEKPKYSVEECKARDATYAAPIKVQVRLRNKETERDQGAGDLHGRFPAHDRRAAPLSSTARSASSSPRSSAPPACTTAATDGQGRQRAPTPPPSSPTAAPGWSMRPTSHDVFWVRIDKNRKLPITCLHPCHRPEDRRRRSWTCSVRIPASWPPSRRTPARPMRRPCSRSTASCVPASPPRWTPPRPCCRHLFFDARRYDLSSVGRYKFNKKLDIWPPPDRPDAGRSRGRSLDRRDHRRGR